MCLSLLSYKTLNTYCDWFRLWRTKNVPSGLFPKWSLASLRSKGPKYQGYCSTVIFFTVSNKAMISLKSMVFMYSLITSIVCIVLKSLCIQSNQLQKPNLFWKHSKQQVLANDKQENTQGLISISLNKTYINVTSKECTHRRQTHNWAVCLHPLINALANSRLFTSIVKQQANSCWNLKAD